MLAVQAGVGLSVASDVTGGSVRAGLVLTGPVEIGVNGAVGGMYNCDGGNSVFDGELHVGWSHLAIRPYGFARVARVSVNSGECGSGKFRGKVYGGGFGAELGAIRGSGFVVYAEIGPGWIDYASTFDKDSVTVLAAFGVAYRLGVGL